MANPWDNDEVIGGNPWDADPVVSPATRSGADFSGVRTGFRTTGRELSADEQRRRRVARARAQAEGEAYRAKLEAERMRPDRGTLGQLAIGAGQFFDTGRQGVAQLATSGIRRQLEVPALALEALGATDVAGRYRRGVTEPLRRAEERQQRRVASERVAAEPLQGSAAAQFGNLLAGAGTMIGPGLALRGTAAGRALLPTTVRGNALAGGVYGAAAPVASDAERAGNIAAGATIGGALTAIPAGANKLASRVRSAAIPAAERGAGRSIMREAAGPLDIQQSAVPGVRRTLGEATMNPGVMQLENTVRGQREAVFRQVDDANNAARVAELRKIAGTEAELAAAQAKREAAAQPLYAQARAASVPFDDELRGIIGRLPSTVSSKALELARMQGAPIKQNADKITGDQLHYMKIALDDAIGRKGDGALGNAEKRIAMQVKDDLVDAISKRIPEYGQALAEYRNLSGPISRMKIGRYALDKGDAAVPDVMGNPRLTPARFEAVADLDTTAAKATKFKGAKAKDYLTPQDISTFRAIQDDLRREAQRIRSPSPGSNTAGKLETQRRALARQAIGRAIPGVGGALDYIQTRIDDATQAKIAELLANPDQAKRVIAALSEADKKIVREVLMQFAGAAARTESEAKKKISRGMLMQFGGAAARTEQQRQQ